MTIRLLQPFNGYTINEIVTLDSATEAALISKLDAVNVPPGTFPNGIGFTPNGGLDNAPVAAVTVPLGADARTNSFLLQQACDSGGNIQLPPGYFEIFGTIKINRPTRIVGAGSSDAYAATNGGAAGNGTQGPVYADEANIAATTLYSSSATENMFLVLAHGVTLEAFHMRNTSPTEPTAGSAVQVGKSGTPANGFRMQGCSAYRFYLNVSIVNGDAYALLANKLIGGMVGQIRTQNTENADEGDPIIMGNWLMSGKNSVAPTYGLLYAGGGGLKIIGNKISRMGQTAAADAVRVQTGILLQPPTGVTSTVFTITGNSIEACDVACITIDCTNAPTGNVTITGNEFNCSPSLTNYVLQAVAGANVPQIVYFGGNTIQTCATMVRSAYFDGLMIGPNVINGVTGTLIDIQNGINVGYHLDQQMVRNRPANFVILNDVTGTNYNSNSQRGGTNKRVVREMPAFATASSTVNVFGINMALAGAATLGNLCEIEIAFKGYASALGPFSFTGRRYIYGAGGNTAAIATPAGWTDVCYAPGAAAPAAAYMTLGGSIAGNVCTLQLTSVPAASTPNISTSPFAGVFSGELTLKVDGTVRQIIIS